MADDLWPKCPVCLYRHPFVVPDDKSCPNLNLSVERCQAIFGRDSVLYEPLGPHKPGSTPWNIARSGED